MVNFGNNLEEFVQDFKKRVVDHTSWYYPKEYRKSDKYLEQDLDEKFEQALKSSRGKLAVLSAIETYYNAIKEYEEKLGY